MTKCLNPNCSREAHTRGLCRNCYTTANRLIRAKRTNWELLISRGKAQESRGKAPVVVDWLLKEEET
jgi:hypothetical protein